MRALLAVIKSTFFKVIHTIHSPYYCFYSFILVLFLFYEVKKILKTNCYRGISGVKPRLCGVTPSKCGVKPSN